MACLGRFLPVLPFLLLAVITTTIAGVAADARPATAQVPGLGLARRLANGEGAQQQCWEVLMEIKSCTGEIILFFLNGEAYLGPGCCRAIRVIQQSCWATDAMLSVIGFTPEEGDILKGYCDDEGGAGGQQHEPSQPHAAATLDCVAACEIAAAAVPVPGGRKSLPLHH